MSRENNNNNDFNVSVGSEFVAPEDASKIYNRLRDYAGLLHDPDLIISRICNEFRHISEHRIREMLFESSLVIERTNYYLIEKFDQIKVGVHDLPEDIMNKAIYFDVFIYTNFYYKDQADNLITELSKELGVRKNRFKLERASRYCAYKIICSCPTLADVYALVEVLRPMKVQCGSFKTYRHFWILKMLPTRKAVDKYKLKCRLAGLWVSDEDYRLTGYDGYFVDTGDEAVEIDGKYYKYEINEGIFKLGDIIE